jgi:N utilization substance protein A
VLVREDQLSLAIGRRGQNVRLASKLSGWDIEIMTQDELAESIDRAVSGFSSLTGVEVELAERLVEEGFLSYDDLSIIEPDALMTMGNLTQEQTDVIIEQAEGRAAQAEAQAAEARRAKREQDKLEEMAAEAGVTLSPRGEESDVTEAVEADEFATEEADSIEESDAMQHTSNGTDAEMGESDGEELPTENTADERSESAT